MTEQRMVDVELIRSAVEMLEEDLPYADIALAPKELPVVQLIDKLRAIIASPNVGWQPISTAPKDGTWILAIVTGFVPSVVQWNSAYGRWLKEVEEDWDEAVWVEVVDGVYSPDHWMPLPQPPKED